MPLMNLTCYLCKKSITDQNIIDGNMKTMTMNGRPVNVHRTCPEENEKENNRGTGKRNI